MQNNSNYTYYEHRSFWYQWDAGVKCRPIPCSQAFKKFIISRDMFAVLDRCVALRRNSSKTNSFYFRFFCLSDQIYIRKNITYEPWSLKEKIEKKKKNWPYTSIKSNTYFAIFNNYYLKNDFITRTGFRCSSKIGLKEFVPFFYLIIQLWPRKSEKTKKVYGTKLIVR